ncbi:MAG TPA: hypothetical protein VH413_12500 [Verrucomicrobiae bacterium]|jgi:hypothetical protein|nr:hypothetical protein [Verrucomicrobiae bacterium]
MSKLIGALIIALVIWGGYQLFEVWDTYDKDQDVKAKEAAVGPVNGDQLPGMPDNLRSTYDIAQKNGAVGIRKWLKAYGPKIEDPRLAWIELDYVVLVSHDDPVEAKKVFEDVKARIQPSSPVYPRVKQLEKTYE